LGNFTPEAVQDILFGDYNNRDVKQTNVTNNGTGASPSKQAPATPPTPASTLGNGASPSKQAPATPPTPASTFTASNAAKAAAARSVAKLTVYVVSSNPEHEQGIEFIFSQIPVRLIRMQATDFYTMEQGLYPGMGVDRVASLKAASALFGYPALVLDGGTAMTYTAADCEGNIVGGGILPGLRVKLASLRDYTTSLPMVTVQKLLETVQACSNESRETLPVFARDTETAMLSAVLKETAVNLKSIVQAFVRQMQPDLPPADEDDSEDDGDDDKVNRDFSICITGGDHPIIEALLRPNHRHVVHADPANPADLDFHVYTHKHLGTTGMQRVIWETYQEFNKDAMDEAEDVISSAVTAEMVPAEAAVRAEGEAAVEAAAVTAAKPAVVQPPPASPLVAASLKAASLVAASKVAKESPGAASVSSAKRARNTVEADTSVSKARAKKPKAKEPQAKEPKAKKTKVAAPSPPKPSSAVKQKVNPPIPKKVPPKPPQPIALDDSTDDDFAEEAEVVVKEDNAESPEPAPGNQAKYIDRRVAKHFGKDLYFGSVDEFYNPDGVDLWHVTYDDGDQEDFELDELIPAFEEYRKNKNMDLEGRNYG
jgi:pantothenate kinase type III